MLNSQEFPPNGARGGGSEASALSIAAGAFVFKPIITLEDATASL